MDVKVGDSVDVPGGMYGTIKFIGPVAGKKGTFAGVDLHHSFWAKGKNNGSVDGKSYFRTSKPTSGIFLPLEKATKRAGPPTPSTPSLANFNLGGRAASSGKPNFSQSVGPGARAASPTLKPALRRPSLPRPGSPLRQHSGAVSTPSARPSAVGFSKSKIGTGPPRFTPGIKSFNPGASLKNGASTPSKQPLGYEPAFDESPEQESTPTPTPVGMVKTIDGTVQQEEMKRLKAQLQEKDLQLKEQSAALSDMEKTLTELQTLMPTDDEGSKHSRNTSNETSDVTQLRALLREKNERIAALTAEFDAHRADFRSTIDTLEMASTETERVYERRVDELLQEIRELQDRGEDVASVAMQLKQLEELVQELEEGLEDARRGEAEARGEVEHLRGEVERTKTELKHERDKAAQSFKSPSPDAARDHRLAKDLHAKEDEIRGLKAIIQSLSRGSVQSPGMNGTPANSADHAGLEKKLRELESVIERKTYREEELERELERLRTTVSLERPQSSGYGNKNRLSDRTVVPVDWRDQNGSRQPLETMQEDAISEVSKATTNLRCELCEEEGHDILNCNNVFGSKAMNGKTGNGPMRTGKDAVAEGLRNLAVPSSRSHEDEAQVAPLSPRRSPATTPRALNGFQSNDYMNARPPPPPPKTSADEEKWCAVCDSEEHNTMECPYEDPI
ncbi:putative cap-gly domain-containing protein [Phaeomoniella chlamydospora]|uniref:Putative cap-gly domain-containing protein n=1 Tax=Phaeomoniella chlamydospora TaxID=158046 RepID=A0A0G2E7G8_PHACM|nr:putative cap-gly domain-containing protein [Phaeomoniella chlamydospora]